MDISAQDHQRIGEAVAAAEKGTSGEIRCVLADRTDEPGAGPALWAAAASLVIPPLALVAGLDADLLAGLFGQWSVGHLAASQASVASTLTVFIVLQSAIFALVFTLLSLPGFRRLITPAGVAKARVHAAAVAQFEALGLAATRDRTGILLFASLEDHRAQVLADTGIYEKAPPKVWDEVVALLVKGLAAQNPTDGFVSAVVRSGEVLAACLPPRDDDRNELPDGLVRTGRKPHGKA